MKKTYTQEREEAVQELGFASVDDAITKCVKAGWSNPEIGKLVDLTTGTIWYRIRKLGLKSALGRGGPNNKGRLAEREQIAYEKGYESLESMYRDLYAKGLLLREIAKLVRLKTPASVIRDFDYFGIPRKKGNKKC